METYGMLNLKNCSAHWNQIINATQWSRTFHLELASILKSRAGVTMKGQSSFFAPTKVWTSRHWWQSMVAIRNNETSNCVKMVTKTVRDEQEPIIYLPLINLPRNIYKGLWGEPGSTWATPLICVRTWCFLLYIMTVTIIYLGVYVLWTWD